MRGKTDELTTERGETQLLNPQGLMIRDRWNRLRQSQKEGKRRTGNKAWQGETCKKTKQERTETKPKTITVISPNSRSVSPCVLPQGGKCVDTSGVEEQSANTADLQEDLVGLDFFCWFQIKIQSKTGNGLKITECSSRFFFKRENKTWFTRRPWIYNLNNSHHQGCKWCRDVQCLNHDRTVFFFSADNSCYFNLALLAKYMLVKACFKKQKWVNCFAKWQEWIEYTQDGSLTNVQIKFGSSMQRCEYKTKARPKRRG